jgi:hypothetical protein
VANLSDLDRPIGIMYAPHEKRWPGRMLDRLLGRRQKMEYRSLDRTTPVTLDMTRYQASILTLALGEYRTNHADKELDADTAEMLRQQVVHDLP